MIDSAWHDDMTTHDDRAPALPLPEGWGLWHTGGGCTAWGRNLTGHKDAYAMITGDESALAPCSHEGITLGIYMDAEDEGTCHEGITLSAALAWVQDLERTTS